MLISDQGPPTKTLGHTETVKGHTKYKETLLTLSKSISIAVSFNFTEKEKVKHNEMPNKRTRGKKYRKKTKKTQIIYHIRIQSISNKNIN